MVGSDLPCGAADSCFLQYVVKPLDGKEGQRFFSALRIACVRAMCKSNLTKHDKVSFLMGHSTLSFRAT